eukprot:TRINITY_DN6492_c0_g1_i1.p1 TRINITY_DN6492_c0_g1~~TRINITY_DN6492_c0_g1_i1.p1  ORF type:complete len:256 (-),score=39.72 TRINITY_DN6492_c0_g1_i1:477-1244(-)
MKSPAAAAAGKNESEGAVVAFVLSAEHRFGQGAVPGDLLRIVSLYYRSTARSAWGLFLKASTWQHLAAAAAAAASAPASDPGGPGDPNSPVSAAPAAVLTSVASAAATTANSKLEFFLCTVGKPPCIILSLSTTSNGWFEVAVPSRLASCTVWSDGTAWFREPSAEESQETEALLAELVQVPWALVHGLVRPPWSLAFRRGGVAVDVVNAGYFHGEVLTLHADGSCSFRGRGESWRLSESEGLVVHLPGGQKHED